MAAVFALLTLGVVAVIIKDFTESGSQGPAVINDVSSGVSGFYNAIASGK